MRPLSMIFVGHFLGILVTLFGAWWIVANISAIPEYKLVIVFAALNILVLNHVRWWRLGRRLDKNEMLGKVSHIVVSNYMVMMLFLVMLDFGR
ncbi:MAG: hypothetical protein P8Z37_17880 [Acidobacteriota bacterium]|jgi:hypothetical protein